MRRTTSWLLLGSALFALAGVSGCGHSEEEWQAKLREIEALNSKIADEQKRTKKAQAEIDDAKAQIAQLKEQLKAAGVDISKLNANLEEQSRALEDYRRRAEQLEAIKKRFELLREKLQALTKMGLKVTVRNNRMVIQLPGDVLFERGKETLKKDGESVLLGVAEVIRGDAGLSQRSFQVAGHTDADKLEGGKFKDNWGLSVMRAREVLAYLVAATPKGGGLSPEKWSAAGYGDTDPVKPNDTDENKQANRRCELVVLPNVEEMLDLKTLAN